MQNSLDRPLEEIEENQSNGLNFSIPLTLGLLPVGGRLIIKCRKDWRHATVASLISNTVVLSVASPFGGTYRVRRPSDAPLYFEGAIPILGIGSWRNGIAHYDMRW
jgi:hypothetical protein